MAQPVHHPFFARVYERIAIVGERRGTTEHRRALLAGCEGRVIEVGAGSGTNFAHYPPSVSEVLAVEPERYLREQARRASVTAPVPVSVVDANAELLPDTGEPFDVGVVSLVLCSVPDQQRALAQLFKAIRPGGELRFYEHVVAHAPRQARMQRLADATFWPRAAGGCHLARDTMSAIEQAGFEVQACERFAFSPAPLTPPTPHVLGTAVRSAATAAP
ncbi:MAG: class I SAM-dependent methyltransferase [Solirubrobacteraceae bacterium]